MRTVQILLRVSPEEKKAWDEFRMSLRWTMNGFIRTSANRFIVHSKNENTDPLKLDPNERLLAVEQKLDELISVSSTLSRANVNTIHVPNAPAADTNASDVERLEQVIRDKRELLVSCRTVDELILELVEIKPDLHSILNDSGPVRPLDEALLILRKNKIVERDRGKFLKWNLSKSLEDCLAH